MQGNILPLIIINMHLNFCLLSSLLILEVSPNDIVRSAGGKAMSKFAAGV